MPTYRHPVLLWTDTAGFTTAALVGDYEDAAAYASTEEDALRQLRDLLQWRIEHERWAVEPELSNPELSEVKVEVRPQYADENRVLPCPETIWLKVPCVSGLRDDGLLVATVPHLGLRFDYQTAGELRSLVAHFVKEALHGLSPLQLTGRMPPRDCRLSELVVREGNPKTRRASPEQREDLKILFTVAAPLLHDQRKRRNVSSAFGRDLLVTQLSEKLARENTNLLLVGEPGVGKSTVLLQAARRLPKQQPAPATGAKEEGSGEDLKTYRLWRGTASRIIAGMRYLGEWEERCESFIAQLEAINGVFCAENLLELIRVGGTDPGGSVGAFLLPYLERGELRMVAEATPTEVDACRRQLPGLLDAFQIVHVPLFSEDEATQVLEQLSAAQAKAARLEVEPGVPALAQSLFRRFQPYAVFPGPAARFIRELFTPDKSTPATVTRRDVMQSFTKLTGLPEVFLSDDALLSCETVEQQFSSRIIGQPEATSLAAKIVTTIKAGLADPNRPYGSLLFCGPTGVGKTELAKTLAQWCFGGAEEKDRLVRLDMSEYNGWDAVPRFLQSPNGGPSAWIERVRQQPFCVLLFDEIEKAAPEVFDAMMGLLDEGRLTDPFGRVTQFRSAIVILTSNLGATAAELSGFGPNRNPHYETEVAKFFRPEFFNRLDAVIAFRKLSEENVKSIAGKELAALASREGMASAGLQLEWSEAVEALVARTGYDHRFGARPLQRTLERLVATPLARWKVAHPEARNTVLRLELNDENLVEVTTPSAP